MFQLRQATPADAAAITQVHAASWKTTYRGIVPDELLDSLSAEQQLADWRENLRHSDQITIVAETVAPEIVGFASGGRQRQERTDFLGELYAI